MFSSCLLFAALLTNCADVANCVFARQIGYRFDLTGQVLVIDNHNDPVLNVADASGGTRVMGVRHVVRPLPFKSGDTIHVAGVVDIPFDKPMALPCAICQSANLVEAGTLEPPANVSASDILSGRYDCRLVRIGGRIRRVIQDEIDTTCLYVQFLADDNILYLTTRVQTDTSIESRLRDLIDADVEVVGTCHPSAYMRRRFIGYTIGILGIDAITILKRTPQDPHSVPLLDVNMVADISAFNRLGRRRLVGTVLAPCSGKRIILETDGGNIHDVNLLEGTLPPCGQKIEVVGIPDADYYQINLVDATWRDAPGVPIAQKSTIDVSIERLLTDGKGHAQIDPSFHGRVIRTTGTLIDIPTPESGRDFAILKDSGGTLFLDISSVRQILETVTAGCRIRVSGVCTVNRESAMAPQRFQRVNGVTLVVRTPDDVEVLERPPWWTPMRLMTVVCVLLLAILAFFIWNRLLQRVIERKSRQLMREQLAHAKASFRIEERTHLTVELHDSLSQNLSGVACQIAATKGTLPAGADRTARYLSTAERMLLSCRTELRRCLWDLRENALEEKDFAEAIRKTLAPVVDGSVFSVQFNVPRARLDDTTAHAILCIIRELATNAIHHGKAHRVRICGELQDGLLTFSVSDDGSGFNPDSAAGANEGHFGLEGIHERIKRLNGTFTIISEPGKGCTAHIKLKV